MTRRAHPDHPARPTRGLAAILARFWRARSGNIAPIMAILAVPIVASLAVGTEASNWFFTYRSAQNAADSAVLAAANNSGSYQTTGQAVAAQYGYVSSSGTSTDTLVSVSSGVTCPNANATSCYTVSVQRKLPIYLTAFVPGYSGDTTTSSGAKAKLIVASATAGSVGLNPPLCMLALAQAGPAITTNGTPNFNLNGCSVQSDSNSTKNGQPSVNCNGSAGLGAGSISTPGSIDKNCGPANTFFSSSTYNVSDPYSSLSNSTNIPTDSCNQASQQTAPPLTALGGGTVKVCGNETVANNITVSSDTVLIVYDGYLDLSGKTVKTSSGAGLTIVFAGVNTLQDGSVPYHTLLLNKGTLDIAAPTTNTNSNWSGIAIYQQQTLTDQTVKGQTKSLDFSFDGSQSTLRVTGVVDLHYADFNIGGDIDQSTSGVSCFILVSNTITISGTGYIYAHSQSQCPQAGVTQVTGTANRVVLLR